MRRLPAFARHAAAPLVSAFDGLTDEWAGEPAPAPEAASSASATAKADPRHLTQGGSPSKASAGVSVPAAAVQPTTTSSDWRQWHRVGGSPAATTAAANGTGVRSPAAIAAGAASRATPVRAATSATSSPSPPPRAAAAMSNTSGTGSSGVKQAGGVSDETGRGLAPLGEGGPRMRHSPSQQQHAYVYASPSAHTGRPQLL